MFPLDKLATLPALRGTETPKAERFRGIFCLRLIALTLSMGLININNSFALNANDPKELKGYAYSKMSWQKFECYNWLIQGESRWNPHARNGSHYGLAQMRNPKVARLNGFQQIDWHLRYLKHRYKNDACLALRHFETKGWH